MDFQRTQRKRNHIHKFFITNFEEKRLHFPAATNLIKTKTKSPASHRPNTSSGHLLHINFVCMQNVPKKCDIVEQGCGTKISAQDSNSILHFFHTNYDDVLKISQVSKIIKQNKGIYREEKIKPIIR